MSSRPGCGPHWRRPARWPRPSSSCAAHGPAGAAVRGINGGVHLLVDALASRLGDAVRTDVRVSVLRRDGDGWEAEASAGDGSTMRIRARAVAIAVPAPVAAALLAPILTSSDNKGGEGLDALASPETTDVVLATIVLDEPLLDAAPRGTGILVARQATDVRAKALTHATAKWPWLADAAGPGRHVVRLSYGRGGDDGAADRLSGTAIAPGSGPVPSDRAGRCRDAAGREPGSDASAGLRHPAVELRAAAAGRRACREGALAARSAGGAAGHRDHRSMDSRQWTCCGHRRRAAHRSRPGRMRPSITRRVRRLTLDSAEIRVTPLGRIFIRNIAMVFDRYLREQQMDQKPLFSKTL